MRTMGERIRAKRLQNGYTQAELAVKIGSTQGTIANWENDATKPSAEKLRQLKKIIGGINKALLISDQRIEDDSGGGLFSVWLNKERLGKNLSVAELADKSKVATSTIYGIENGSFGNPSEKVRQKLEKALDKKPEAEIIKADIEANQISELGALTDFNPYEPDDIPTEEGVYVLYDVSQRPIYVGKSENIQRRLSDHRDKFWFRSPIVQRGSYVLIKNKILRTQVESVLIKFLKSNAVINKQQVERNERSQDTQGKSPQVTSPPVRSKRAVGRGETKKE